MSDTQAQPKHIVERQHPHFVMSKFLTETDLQREKSSYYMERTGELEQAIATHRDLDRDHHGAKEQELWAIIANHPHPSFVMSKFMFELDLYRCKSLYYVDRAHRLEQAIAKHRDLGRDNPGAGDMELWATINA